MEAVGPNRAALPESRTWLRAVEPQFWQVALQTAQAKTYPSRFNVAQATSPAFETLYLAENYLVALFEVQALFGVPHPQKALVVLNVQVSLATAVDLPQRFVNGKSAEISFVFAPLRDKSVYCLPGIVLIGRIV
ncbi:MAG: RES domain-containing protein [Armatimonadota bacterium]|nr:RES domain-containing protein [Armatimonadota bacterium]